MSYWSKMDYLNKVYFNLRITAIIPSYRRFSSITTRMTAPAIPADATHNFNNSLMISISFIHDAVVIHGNVASVYHRCVFIPYVYGLVYGTFWIVSFHHMIEHLV